MNCPVDALVRCQHARLLPKPASDRLDLTGERSTRDITIGEQPVEAMNGAGYIRNAHFDSGLVQSVAVRDRLGAQHIVLGNHHMSRRNVGEIVLGCWNDIGPQRITRLWGIAKVVLPHVVRGTGCPRG